MGIEANCESPGKHESEKRGCAKGGVSSCGKGEPGGETRGAESVSTRGAESVSFPAGSGRLWCRRTIRTIRVYSRTTRIYMRTTRLYRRSIGNFRRTIRIQGFIFPMESSAPSKEREGSWPPVKCTLDDFERH